MILNLCFFKYFLLYTLSPAIPLSKGEPTVSIRSPVESETTQSPESLPESAPEIDTIGKYYKLVIFIFIDIDIRLNYSCTLKLTTTC